MRVRVPPGARHFVEGVKRMVQMSKPEPIKLTGRCPTCGKPALRSDEPCGVCSLLGAPEQNTR